MSSSKIPVSRNRLSSFKSGQQTNQAAAMEESRYEELLKEFEEYKEDKERELLSLEEEIDILEGELHLAQNGGVDNQATAEIDVLRKTIQDLEQKLDEKENTEVALNREIDQLNRENEEINALMRDAQMYLDEPIESNGIADQNTTHAPTEKNLEVIQKLEREKKDLIKDQEKLKEKLIATDSELKLSKDTMKRKSDEITYLKNKIDGLEGKMKELKLSETRAMQSFSKDKDIIDKLTNQLKERTSTVKRMEAEIATLKNLKVKTEKDKLHDIEEIRKAEQKKRSDLEKKNKKLAEEISTLQSNKTESNKVIAELQKKAEKSSNSRSSEKEELKRVKLQLVSRESEVESLARQLEQERESTEVSIAALEEQIRFLEQQLSDSTTKYDEVVEEKCEIENKFNNLREFEYRHNELEKKYKENCERLEFLEAELESNRKTRTDTELKRDLEKKSKALLYEQEKRSHLSEELERANQEIMQLQNELEASVKAASESIHSKSVLKTSRIEDTLNCFEEDRTSVHEQELMSLNLLKRSREERRNLEHRLSEVTADKNSLEIKVSFLTRELQDKENTVIDLIEVGSEKVKNKMDLSVELEKKLREERMVMDELDMQLQCVRNENESLKRALQSSLNDTADREDKVNSLNLIVNRREQESNELRNQIENMLFQTDSNRRSFHRRNRAFDNPNIAAISIPRVPTGFVFPRNTCHDTRKLNLPSNSFFTSNTLL